MHLDETMLQSNTAINLVEYIDELVGLLDKSNKSIIDGVKQTSTFLLFFIKWCFNNLCTYFFIPYNNKYIIV